MARTDNLSNFLTDVAGAIKEKKGSEISIPAANFDTEIRNLPSQGTYEDKSVNITTNGNTVVTPGQNYDAMSRVTINTAVPEKQLQTKSYTFTQNANLELEPDTGYDGFSKVGVTINVSGGSSLPYTELEYIESTGTQYINTNVTNARKFTGKIAETSHGGMRYLFGSQSAYEIIFRDNGGSYYIRQSQGSNLKEALPSFPSSDIFEFNVDFINNEWQLDTQSGTFNDWEFTATVNYNFYLLARNNSGSASDFGRFKIYNFKMYDSNDTLIRDLIPVKRNSDNVICLYDKVSREYFTNAGTGTFVAGPEKSNPNIVDTSDATATASDIAQNKTAYVKGQKITGTLIDAGTSIPLALNANTVNSYDNNYLYITTDSMNEPIILPSGGKVTTRTANNLIATAANLTANKIKKDETILGVTGTYEGSGSANLQEKSITANGTYTPDTGYDGFSRVTVNVQDEEYATNLALSEQILGITAPYTELEYIESTGTQYIDTGIIPNQDTGFIADFTMSNSISTRNAGYLFSSRTNYQSNRFQLSSYATYSGGQFGYADTDDYDPGIQQNVRCRVVLDNKHFINANGDNETIATRTFTCPVSLVLFACNDNGTKQEFGSVRLYSFVLSDNGTVVRDFIPVKRNSDNVVCLYDRVSGEYFTNQGTGSFTPGPEV